MNITDNIVDNFVEKLQSNGIAIQSHAGIDWIEKIIRLKFLSRILPDSNFLM
jgi:hypothetical protein